MNRSLYKDLGNGLTDDGLVLSGEIERFVRDLVSDYIDRGFDLTHVLLTAHKAANEGIMNAEIKHLVAKIHCDELGENICCHCLENMP